jgi:flagellar basal body-associated protein FliL
MRALAIPTVLLVLTASAFAAEDAPKKKAEEPGTHVQMPFLIAPVSVGGKLQGYVYISSKLVASTPAASVEIREKLAFIQDAFVRDVNAKDVATGPDLSTVDKAALTARLVGDARRIVGAAKVVSIMFTQMQFSPLHPKSTTEDAIPPSERNQPPAVAQTPASQAPTAVPDRAKTP